MINHQLKQIDVINAIEKEVNASSLSFSTVSPVQDFENDPRICLTGVHFPHETLLTHVHETLIKPIQAIEPAYFYYPKDSLHLTIKNIRVITDPPNFSNKDVEKARNVFSDVIPAHHAFRVYFYRLLLFPNDLALIGTTDPELDEIVLELDKSLRDEGIPDDKVYLNSRYFFSNMTLCRFTTPPSETFKKKVKELSDSLSFEPYTIDSVTLLSANAVMKKRTVYGSWPLLGSFK